MMIRPQPRGRLWRPSLVVPDRRHLVGAARAGAAGAAGRLVSGGPIDLVAAFTAIAGNGTTSYSDTIAIANGSAVGRFVAVGLSTVAGADRAPYTFTLDGIAPTGTAGTSSPGNGDNHCQLVFWDNADLPASAGDYTLQVEASGAFTCHMLGAEYENVASGGPDDSGTDNQIGETAVTVTATEGGLVITMAATQGNVTYTWSAGTQRGISSGQPAAHSGGFADQIGVSSGGITETVTPSGGGGQRQVTAAWSEAA